MQTDHVKMLCEIGELNDLFHEKNIDDFLSKIVSMVASHMLAEVCSIYIYDETKNELILKATKGLKTESINMIRLKPGEGLVGTALKKMQPIIENNARKNPKFKFYPGINEELYDAFLAVPLSSANRPIGILVVQRESTKPFMPVDITAMKAMSSQLGTMIENIKLIMIASEPEPAKIQNFNFEKYKFIKGKTASEGFVVSKSRIYQKSARSLLNAMDSMDKFYKLEDFNQALIKTEEQLEELQKNVEEKLSDAASLIFSSHLLMLKDPLFTGGIRDHITKGDSAEKAISKVFFQYQDIFSKSQNPLIREKIQDIEDLSIRILENMNPVLKQNDSHEDMVLIAEGLFPSDLLLLAVENTAGIVLISGGITSHVSILARSLKLPLIFVDDPELLKMPDDSEVLLDADLGNLYIKPTPEIIYTFRKKHEATIKLKCDTENLKSPALTKDGTELKLMANINLISDANGLEDCSVDSVGLYRTEFPFMIRNNFPTEEEQYVIYKKLISSMNGKNVTFRTLDIGGDKVLTYYDMPKEENPFLGMRSIRFSLSHEEIFKQQLRAILRAGYKNDIKIMFPMVSSVDDLLQLKSILKKCVDELKNENENFNKSPQVGIMIEIPSVIHIIDELAKICDFFSIGTNDLVQYTLAVDRTNEKVAKLYTPHHPAILRMLKIVADSANSHNIDVSICGDIASQERYLPFLLGIGITSISVDPLYFPRVKNFTSNIDMKKAKLFAKKLLKCSTIAEIEKIIKK